MERIGHLDGLRGVAILLVIGYHFFSRWVPPRSAQDLYPYGDVFARVPLFRFGDFGVELFFVISGYVIAMTLFRCRSLGEFALRRFARLWPAMALCSLLTFLVLRALAAPPFAASALHFVPSLTFIDPVLFRAVTGNEGFDWMDGGYWSLFVEVRFYAFVALIYFASPARFAPNLLHLGLASGALQILAYVLRSDGLRVLTQLLFVAPFLGWFLFGIAFFLMNRTGPSFRSFALLAVGALQVALQALQDNSIPMAIAGGIIPLLFFGAFKLPKLQAMLSRPALRSIGAASYSLYLLHEYIGVSLIGALGRATGLEHTPTAAALALVVGAALVLFSLFVFRYWEAPLNRAIVAFGIRGRAPKARAAPH
jgi:peptidoglycan/LPS O-acetylase OafA/YrhL